MAVLSYQEILGRLTDIFENGTYDKELVRDASYDLRLAPDGCLVGNDWTEPEARDMHEFRLEPGEIAILSTVEEFKMPENLVGMVEIKFTWLLKGLILLFGSRVDPGYGKYVVHKRGEPGAVPEVKPQRMYLRVQNVSNEVTVLESDRPLWMIEFHTLSSRVEYEQGRHPEHRPETSKRIRAIANGARYQSVEQRLSSLAKEVERAKLAYWGLLSVGFVGILLAIAALVISVLTLLGMWVAAPGN